jgi:hypothetical protein
MCSSRELSLLEGTGMGTFNMGEKYKDDVVYVFDDDDFVAFTASETDVNIIDIFD